MNNYLFRINLKILIIDGLYSLYSEKNDINEKNKWLKLIGTRLKFIAQHFSIPVLIINNMVSQFNEFELGKTNKVLVTLFLIKINILHMNYYKLLMFLASPLYGKCLDEFNKWAFLIICVISPWFKLGIIPD